MYRVSKASSPLVVSLSNNEFTVARYGRRYWAVVAPAGDLVCVTLYRKGAEEVIKRLSSKKGGLLF